MARILVVDDSPSVRAFLCEVLAAAGHELDTAADGRDGLDRFHRNRPDLVVTDIVMPEMDGLELLVALRQSGARTAVIVVSSGGELVVPELLLHNATLLGAHRTLAKPVQPEQLVEAVEAMLERYRPQTNGATLGSR